MDQEFDLQEYVLVVLRRWRLVVALMLVAAILGSVIVWLRPPLYRATVALAVAQGQFFWTFTGTVRSTLDPKQDLRRNLVTSQAASQDAAEAVLARVGDLLTFEQNDPAVLVKQVSGKMVKTSLTAYELSVEDRNPETAALLANTWAEVLSKRMEDLYGIGELTIALEKAQAELDEIDRQIEEFNARTGLRLVMGGDITAAGDSGTVYTGLPSQKLHLVIKNAALTDYEEAADRLRLILTYAQEAVAEGRGISVVPLELLGTSLLKIRGLEPELSEAYAEDLPGLVTLLSTHLQEIERVEEDLQQQVETIQAEIASDEMTLTRLEREQQIVRETVFNLERQVQQIQSQRLVEGPLVSIVRPAEVPTSPSGLPIWMIALLATMVGALAGVLLVLAWEALHIRVAVRQPTTG